MPTPNTQPLAEALLIDHDDSFTQNIRAWLSPKFNVDVVHHLKIDLTKINSGKYQLILFSPGPKSPLDYPESLKLLKNISSSQHVLGICLGLQMMTIVCDGHVLKYSPPLHGKTSPLESSLPQFHGKKVARYHSMKCDLPENEFRILAQAELTPMWAVHHSKKWMGFQFHPESFLTESSELYLQHVCDWMSS